MSPTAPANHRSTLLRVLSNTTLAAALALSLVSVACDQKPADTDGPKPETKTPSDTPPASNQTDKPAASALPKEVTVLEDAADIANARRSLRLMVENSQKLITHKVGTKLTYKSYADDGSTRTHEVYLGKLESGVCVRLERIVELNFAEWSLFFNASDYEIGGDLDHLARCDPASIKADRFVEESVTLADGTKLASVGLSVEDTMPSVTLLLSDAVPGFSLVKYYQDGSLKQELASIEQDVSMPEVPAWLTRLAEIKAYGLDALAKLTKPGAWVIQSASVGSEEAGTCFVVVSVADGVAKLKAYANGAHTSMELDLATGRARTGGTSDEAWSTSIIKSSRIILAQNFEGEAPRLGSVRGVGYQAYGSSPQGGRLKSLASYYRFGMPEKQDQPRPFLFGLAPSSYTGDVLSFGASLSEMPSAMREHFQIKAE